MPGSEHPAAYDHRSEKMRQAFGFSRFYWYVVAPVELRIRHLPITLLKAVKNAGHSE